MLSSGVGCTVFDSWCPMGTIVPDSTKVGVLDTHGGLRAAGLQQIADGTSRDDESSLDGGSLTLEGTSVESFDLDSKAWTSLRGRRGAAP